MNPKTLLVGILSADQRIRDYEKSPTKANADRCITAYKEAVTEFCKKYDLVFELRNETYDD